MTISSWAKLKIERAANMGFLDIGTSEDAAKRAAAQASFIHRTGHRTAGGLEHGPEKLKDISGKKMLQLFESSRFARSNGIAT